MISIVLPTYNERENVPLICDEIHRTLVEEGLDHEIIVVDDDSPDGTAEAARALAPRLPVRVLARSEGRGLARAVMAGFEIARGDVLVVMDADLSHPVAKLGEMLRPVLEGRCEATVGSRYVAGGGKPDWPWIRQLIGRTAGMLARGVTSLSDPTSGFMAIRRDVLERAELAPVGWKIVLETVIRTRADVQEVGIVFVDRTHGRSKFGPRPLVEYLVHLGRLYAFRISRRLREGPRA